MLSFDRFLPARRLLSILLLLPPFSSSLSNSSSRNDSKFKFIASVVAAGAAGLLACDKRGWGFVVVPSNLSMSLKRSAKSCSTSLAVLREVRVRVVVGSGVGVVCTAGVGVGRV